MKTLVWCSLLFPLWALAAPVSPPPPLPVPVNAVTLAPAEGYWSSISNTNLAFNPNTNRIVTIVNDPTFEGGKRVVRFDASTDSFAGGTAPAGLPGRTLKDLVPLGTAISPDGTRLLIGWGDRGAAVFGTERELALGLESFNLGTFSATDSAFLDIPFYQFDIDRRNNRLVGIADPEAPETEYAAVTIALPTGVIAARSETGFATTEVIPRDVVFDPAANRLLVLFLPTLPSDPTRVEKEAFVAAYDADSGILEATSETFAGEFLPHSMALSPTARKLVVVPNAGNNREVPVLNADTLALEPFIQETGLDPDFESNGAGAFVTDSEVWLANGVESRPDLSIAVYDIQNGTLVRFIRNADESQAFEVDQETDRAFVASEVFQQVYLLDATDTALTTQVDFALVSGDEGSVDLSVDPDRNTFQVLSHSGGLHLVSDSGPVYLGRLLHFAPDPKAGLLSDPDHDRLFVGRRPEDPALVLETESYQEIGRLPVASDALAYDADRNLVYADTVTGVTRTLNEIDGTDFTLIGPVAQVPRLARSAPVMEVDPINENLWILNFSVLGSPTLYRFHLHSADPPVTYVFAGRFFTQARLVLDPVGNRMLLVPRDAGGHDVEAFAFPLNGPDLSNPMRINLESQVVFDVAGSPGNGFLYLLTFSPDVPKWRLAAIDLADDPDQLSAVYALSFLPVDENNGRLTYNPSTDRFAVLSGSAGRLYFFDNPFSKKTRSTKRDRSKNLSLVSVNVGQTVAGIELNWTFDGTDEGFPGVVVERRRSPDQEWIRLNPVPVPPDVTTWTDVTVERGESYEYRVRAAERKDGPRIRAESTAAREDWLATIPEVLVYATPGESVDLMLSVTSRTPEGPWMTLDVAADSLLGATLFPRHIPQPGVARLVLDVSPGIPTGKTYSVQVVVRDGRRSEVVPLLVRVLPAGSQVRLRRVPRDTTTITMTSDSDLDQRLLSVRGQLGLLRRKVNPVRIIVDAVLPDGATVRKEVVASTGEFTADFQVPPGAETGDWKFVATMPGGTDSVGGRSVKFVFPFINRSHRKGQNVPDREESGADLPPEKGQVVLIQGLGRTPEDRSGLQDVINGTIRTLVGNRYSETLGSLHIETTPKKATVESVLGEIESRRYVLIYLIGDAFKDQEGRVHFRLNDDENLTPEDLQAYVTGFIRDATPLIIIDSPYAGGFEQSLQSFTKGAFIFSTNNSYENITFGQEGSIFTHMFMRKIDQGFGLGRSLDLTAGNTAVFNLPYVPGGRPLPEGIRALAPPYSTLEIGSSFTPPRALIKDRIPPVIQFVQPSQSSRPDEEKIPLELRVYDPPFDLPVKVKVTVGYPDGSTESFLVEGTKLESAPGWVFGAGLEKKSSGKYLVSIVAQDPFGMYTIHTSTIVAIPSGEKEMLDIFPPDNPDGRIDQGDLLEFLNHWKRHGSPACLSSDLCGGDVFLGYLRHWRADE